VLPASYKIFRPDLVQKLAAPGEESWVQVMKLQKCVQNVNILVFTLLYIATQNQKILRQLPQKEIFFGPMQLKFDVIFCLTAEAFSRSLSIMHPNFRLAGNTVHVPDPCRDSTITEYTA
jgi:hypothetical protein